MKHGLTGEGVVVSPLDHDEIEQRNHQLNAELAPRTLLGTILIRQLATLSVRIERSARQETYAIAQRVRHATEAFDLARVEQVEALFQGLADNPAKQLRELRKSPDGVNRLIVAWEELREILKHERAWKWTLDNLRRFANLLGLAGDGLTGTRLAAFSNAAWGNMSFLDESERVGKESLQIKNWASRHLIERIDAEIAALEAHRATLDDPLGRLDRAEAADRALFDPSKEATLARRYEAEARRGFFKALNEFRQIEAEAAKSIDEPEVESHPADLASSRSKAQGTEIKPRPSGPERSQTSRNDHEPLKNLVPTGQEQRPDAIRT